MSKESSYNSIILKKTPYNEADEILTVFTEEGGKMRFLAKSVKLAKSKLQNNLQSLFLCNLRIANSRSGKLSKIIGCEVLQSFSHLRESLPAIKAAISAAEIVLKFMPDEQANLGVFSLLKIFFNFLDQTADPQKIEKGFLAFKIKFLELTGFGIQYPKTAGNAVFFSSARGGFTDSLPGSEVALSDLENFLLLRDASFNNFPVLKGNLQHLPVLVDEFLEYNLERELKAEKSLRGVV